MPKHEITLGLAGIDNETSGIGWFQLGDGHTMPRFARERDWLELHGLDPKLTPVNSDVSKVIGRRAWAVRQFLRGPNGGIVAGAMGVAVVAFRLNRAGQVIMPVGHTGWRP